VAASPGRRPASDHGWRMAEREAELDPLARAQAIVDEHDDFSH
jgi:hypothetical protein